MSLRGLGGFQKLPSSGRLYCGSCDGSVCSDHRLSPAGFSLSEMKIIEVDTNAYVADVCAVGLDSSALKANYRLSADALNEPAT